MAMHVQPVADHEVEAAFAVLAVVGARLEREGRRQRISRTTLEAYERWQSADANHAVIDERGIVGVFTLIREPLQGWPDVGIAGAVPFIRALATHPDHRGRGIGAYAIRTALSMIEPHEHLYLDCVSDSLPTYYESLGFERVARQVRSFADEGRFDITLLRHRNGG